MYGKISSKKKLTLDIEIVAIPDCALQEHTDRIRQLLEALIAKSRQREILVSAIIDLEVTDLGLCIWMLCLNHII